MRILLPAPAKKGKAGTGKGESRNLMDRIEKKIYLKEELEEGKDDQEPTGGLL
ncbi:MAG TPA: hypothetical protein GXZ26_08475 [Firmicutes bacterium]|jgi:hypothetical protein|nr:hypothetical protein [Bacillota bacterium]